MAEPEEVVDEDKDCFFCQLEARGPGGARVRGSLPHESIKTGSVNLTMGKWRRLPM